ncbi:DEAD/DEAH box helicase [Mesorhizobium sp. ESP7-2]|uniref:DEAD/DEAH box helicase n=1 Tax=Mesorhizobium sp. ESP7-2 TaxID=2876622 RepID=UPI001CCCA17A|nr:DEAD/DEAH box helicase [Mesorhizobium sp. ESP7-2]MBZ9711469.1 DEAD/DEAH box helicase [Mesorhizobium sp. ESP7-2]
MISIELYRQGRPTVIVERSDDAKVGAWARLQEALARGVITGSAKQTVVHADIFLAELDVLRELRAVFAEPLQLGPGMRAQLELMAADRKAREAAVGSSSKPVDLTALEQELCQAGFKRKLKSFQLQNLAKVLLLPHAADFSVPGAGKTTLALAAYAIRRQRKLVDRLMVVAPIAAFEAWKEEAKECFEAPPKMVFYSGPETFIPSDTNILISNYNRVANDYDRIRDFVASADTQVVLDEAHRVKRGADGVHGRAVLDLAYAARRRDVLTGTPAPQGAYDLVALVKFLYPGQDRQILPEAAYIERLGRDDSVLAQTRDAISQYFVRTRKTDLDLPDTKFKVIRRPMSPIQSAIYDALIGRYRHSFALEDRSRHEMERIGRIVMYLLEAATNPMLLTSGSDDSDDPGFLHPPIELEGDESVPELLARYGSYETPWKYKVLAAIVADAAEKGEKVLVWTNFVRNIRLLSRQLVDFNPASVHGGVPSEATAAPGVVTRESEFNRFRHDDSCSVLLANPAACGEGVSLHHWCHHAVYLDRSFNAGHFLQSQDRIHRLGLDKNVLTRFTLLISEGTIDDAVDGRLHDKVRALSALMDDPGLVQIALPSSDEGEDGAPVFDDDVAAVMAHIGDQDARAP